LHGDNARVGRVEIGLIRSARKLGRNEVDGHISNINWDGVVVVRFFAGIIDVFSGLVYN